MRAALRLFVLLLFACPLAHATVWPVTIRSNIQNVINGASAGDTISFAAGTYAVGSGLTGKCGITYTGPVQRVVNGIVNPATAKLTTSTANVTIFSFSGRCTTGTTTIEYLRLDGAGGLYFGPDNHSNINILYNQFTTLPEVPDQESCNSCAAAIFFDGNNRNSDSNITIEYNTMGDSNSCTAGMTLTPESNLGDGCRGIFDSLVGSMTNLVIRYNTFQHLLEGIHFVTVNFVAGNPAPTCNNCDIEFNYFNQIHRMSVEVQLQVVGKPLVVNNNVFMNPYSGYFESYAASLPCCQYGRTLGANSNANPAVTFESNLQISNLSPGFEWGVEAWGLGALFNHNMLQGQLCLGFEPGNHANMQISNNIMQGPIMAGHSSCPNYSSPGGFIGSPENGATPPTTIGNVQGVTPTAITSVMPTISPASGSQAFPLAVTLTDPGYTSGTQPLGNTGIWYTTDGSTPVPGSGTAQYLVSGGSFILPAAATVKAVGMFGTPPEPTSYPAGYGFTPSAVVSATYHPPGARSR
jgi:hypothetical protein